MGKLEDIEQQLPAADIRVENKTATILTYVSLPGFHVTIYSSTKVVAVVWVASIACVLENRETIMSMQYHCVNPKWVTNKENSQTIHITVDDRI